MAKSYFYDGTKKVKKVYLGVEEYQNITTIFTNLVPAITSQSGWEGAKDYSHTQFNYNSSSLYKKYSNNTYSLRLNSSTSAVESCVHLTSNLGLISGHYYYIRGEVYFTSTAGTRNATIFLPIEGSSFTQFKDIPATTWTKISAIKQFHTNNLHDSSADFRFDFDHNKGGGYMYLDGIMLIDLGTSPQFTQAYLDSLDYFTGSKSIITGQTSIIVPKQIKKIYGGTSSGVELLYEASSFLDHDNPQGI